MGAFKVGGELDAYCGRCKMELRHTILALVASKVVRVRCNTCGSDHGYRDGTRTRAAASSSASRTPAKVRVPKVVVSFEEQLTSKDLGQVRNYSPKLSFAMEEVMNHPTFGMGIVSAVRQDKVDVTFKTMVKTLIHARSDTPSAKPVYAPPRAAAEGPADKPAPPAEETP